MEAILSSLGINSTLYIHFVIFFVAYLALSQLVFKPYLKAFEARQKATVGSADVTSALWKETEALRAEYQAKAREINAEIKTVVDDIKKEALAAYQAETQKSQQAYLEQLDQLKVRVETARTQAMAMVDQEVPSVSKAISDRLLGRNAHA
jgi:F0F1-type ATP synthase membrane subunit b/b'